MKAYVDPETGELVEVLPSDIRSTEPYDFADAKRAVMDATREKRTVLRQLDEAIMDKARTEGEYRSALGQAIKAAKAEHGSTVAEAIAKGDPEVVEAVDARDAAKDRVDSLKERLKLCSEDRASMHRLFEWSMMADPDGWRS